MSAAPAGAGPRNALLVTLSFATGATDAFAFLVLGGIFTANMTGNMVLMTLTTRPNYPLALAGAAIAIAAFAATLWAAFRATRATADGQPGAGENAVTLTGAALWLQVVTLALAYGLFLQLPYFSPLMVIAASASAMAVQTAAAKRAGADRSITTTYLTGTITGLMEDLAEDRPGARGLRLAVIAALPMGALMSAGAIQLHPLAGAGLAVLALVLACGFAQSYARALQNLVAAAKTPAAPV